MSLERLHTCYRNMRDRCFNPRNVSYQYYGGRGITVCREWLLDRYAFIGWALSRGYRDDLTLDRINNDGPYSPTNCRWATWEQQANNKRNTIPRFFTFDGITETLFWWAGVQEIPFEVVKARIELGESPEAALEFAPRELEQIFTRTMLLRKEYARERALKRSRKRTEKVGLVRPVWK